MKILLIPAGIVALAVTTTGKACMGKWDRIIQRDSSIISSVTTPTPTPTPAPAATSTATPTPTPTPTASASPGKAKDAQASPAPTQMTAAKAGSGQVTGRFLLGPSVTYFLLHVDLEIRDHEDVPVLQDALRNRKLFMREVPEFLKDWVPEPGKVLQGLKNLSDSIKSGKVTRSPMWKFNVVYSNTVSGPGAPKIVPCFEIRMRVAVEDMKKLFTVSNDAKSDYMVVTVGLGEAATDDQVNAAFKLLAPALMKASTMAAYPGLGQLLDDLSY